MVPLVGFEPTTFPFLILVFYKKQLLQRDSLPD
jgi:hypothetical protein